MKANSTEFRPGASSFFGQDKVSVSESYGSVRSGSVRPIQGVPEQPTVSGPESDAAPPAPIAVDPARTWLAWQRRMVAAIIRGTLYLPADDRHIGGTISTWPGEGEGESQRIEAAARALQQGRGLIRSQQRYGPGNSRTCDLIACPLIVDTAPLAVVAVMISTRSEPQQHAVLQLLQWGGLWMKTLVRQQSARSGRLFPESGGGDIAVRMTDERGLTVAEKVFQVDLGLPEDLQIAGVGERAYVRFEHGAEPLARQWLRNGRQLVLSRLFF